MDGLLLVDKPAGWTSHDVVARIRSNIRAQNGQKTKVGHTGTLDPFATGLLVLVIGGYTKKAAEFSKMDKTYEAEITLGAISTTGDIEGEITPKSGQKPSKMALQAILSRFEGEISQTPHKYSAVKVGGQRAYKLARQGKDVKLEPREVTIYQLQITNYLYPKLFINARVSSGTYIRSLAEDIGEALGTGAYLSALRRTAVGKFKVASSLQIDDIQLDKIKSAIKTG
ncbi:MAG TPA: tRNA pseudouridine(55) synthase TruB [Candidatus Saccharimonadales bacterium]|nr:tRNA pseudouridine(55) synthase TruB [Candidatus Saccharimonadales bacterium]